MGDSTRFDVEKLVTYGHELVDFLKNDGDNITLKQYSQQCQLLHSRSDADLHDLQRPIQEVTSQVFLPASYMRLHATEYQTKLDVCKHNAEATSKVAADEEIDSLEKELDEELKREPQLREELRAIADQINYLEQQSEPIEERRKSLKKLEQEDLRTEMKLSMYASVTSIIPNLDDQSKISGYIVENEKKAVGKFELDPEKQTTFEICNSIWKMINL